MHGKTFTCAVINAIATLLWWELYKETIKISGVSTFDNLRRSLFVRPHAELT